MLFQRNSALFGVDDALNQTHTELNVKIRSLLVKDISLQTRFNQFVPDGFGVEMKIVFKTFGYNYPALKLGSKFDWNAQPSLVVKFSFEVVSHWSLF